MKLLISAIFCVSSIWALVPIHQNLRKVTPGTRIIGGEEARAGQFPWIAAIFKDTEDGKYFCSGALVSNIWILTAAQCVYQAIEFTIQLGSNYLTADDDNRVIVSTSDYVINENFDPTDPAKGLAHDVGLIKLRLPITFTDYIQSIRLSRNLLYPGRATDAAGWGQTSDEVGGLVENLNYAEVVIIDQFECRSYYGTALWNSMICAVGNYNEGICFGDVGGPLVTPALLGNDSVNIAIASFVSQNGCESLDPTGYTRIDSYLDWINNAMANN